MRRRETIRGLWGLTCLTTPGAVLRTAGEAPPDRLSRRVVRLLATRHLTQALVSGLAPHPRVLAVGTCLDAAHALTGVALAALDHRRARPALTDAAVAASLALLAASGAWLQRGKPRT